MQRTSIIDWESQRIFSQIAEQINKPLSEIVRLHKHMLTRTKDIDQETRHISSIILESSEQIEDLIEDILQVEKSKQVEVLLHDKLKYPGLYKLDHRHSKPVEDLLHGADATDVIRISKADLDWLMQIERTILQRIDFDGLNIAWLSQQCATSPRQIFRKIEKYTGLTPNKYIGQLKMYKAQELLEKKRYTTVCEVAMAVGIKDPYYFSKKYQQQFGYSPKKYLS